MSDYRPRLRACVEAWPECSSGEYNPRCCRWPKSCSCQRYDVDGPYAIDPAALDPDDVEWASRLAERGRLESAAPRAMGAGVPDRNVVGIPVGYVVVNTHVAQGVVEILDDYVYRTAGEAVEALPDGLRPWRDEVCALVPVQDTR